MTTQQKLIQKKLILLEMGDFQFISKIASKPIFEGHFSQIKVSGYAPHAEIVALRAL